MNRKLFTALYLLALIVICIIDYFMGTAAQTLNGYEIVRRTFFQPLGISLPIVTEIYIVKQKAFGGWSLLWAWFLYLLWALFWSGLLYFIISRFMAGKTRN